MQSSPSGYSPAFLPVDVPLPRPASDRRVLALASTHFTILFDPVRRLARATGVNIDGALLREIERADDWQLDPRVPANEQAGPELYARNDLDRGHQVRRRDPVWGDLATAERANADTFVYTNAAPQAGVFNQSQELWAGLEDYVLGYARAWRQRISVFTAPVLAADDPVYRGIGIPQRFWKIAAWTTQTRSAGEVARLSATGYLLDQTPELDDIDLSSARALSSLQDRPPPLGPYRTFQVPISGLEDLTGLDFGPLTAADRFAPSRVPTGAAVGAPDARRPLRSIDDVVAGFRSDGFAGEPGP
jgi:endonuclease G, mitochondrial